jgi:hypothetical protein
MTGKSLSGRVCGVYAAAPGTDGQPDFVTAATVRLDLDLTGIPGDLHAGATRRSGAREPWLPRGTVIRNDRQLSALSRAELDEIARRLAIPMLKPEWLGGNLLIEDLPGFSALAPGSRLAFGGTWQGKGRFDGGAILRVEAYNLPCRQAGRALAAFCNDPALEFAFVKQAAELRGLVLSVDLAGSIVPGDSVAVIKAVVPGRG